MMHGAYNIILNKIFLSLNLAVLSLVVPNLPVKLSHCDIMKLRKPLLSRLIEVSSVNKGSTRHRYQISQTYSMVLS